jgi:hypothetical protein
MSRLMRLDATRTACQAQALARKLHSLVVGQDDAIHQIVTAYQTHLAGLTQVGRPIANFLFLGPTGSGKTRIVEATADALLGSSRAVIKIDLGAAEMGALVSPKLGFRAPTHADHAPTYLAATGQIQSHDQIRVTYRGDCPDLTFFRETDASETWETDGVAA